MNYYFERVMVANIFIIKTRVIVWVFLFISVMFYNNMFFLVCGGWVVGGGGEGLIAAFAFFKTLTSRGAPGRCGAQSEKHCIKTLTTIYCNYSRITAATYESPPPPPGAREYVPLLREASSSLRGTFTVWRDWNSLILWAPTTTPTRLYKLYRVAEK